MKALRSFAVNPSLPEPLEALVSIATNLRWSWNARAVELFGWIDPEAWERAEHDPVRMLGLVSKERLRELCEDGPFIAFLATVGEDLERYLEEPRWFETHRESSPLQRVAYFSPEFGVSEALPTYSGGLGVLAGDHLKAASDLGVPLVGIGLLYRQGYFRQQLNADGWQQERYPALDPHGMPLTLLSEDSGAALKVEVDIAGTRCVAQVWQAQVGRIPLLLLDCDVEENDADERGITDRLYAGGSEHRLRQEIVLGIGGVRALKAAGYECDVFHSNEGHPGFLGLERSRILVAEQGLSFEEALEAVRATTVFTTHTPVPAGIDVYDADLMERYFSSFAKECGASFEELLALGQVDPDEEPDSETATFNMAVMGLRLAGRSNAVSKLHGVVSRSLFANMWPAVPPDEVPITSVTNGVHTPTWLGPEIAEVLGRRFAPGWAEGGEGRWVRVAEIPDAEVWRARERARERLVFFIRGRLKEQMLARGASKAETTWTEEVFDPSVLTIGFARRFALYKRATLMLADARRLKRLLLSSDRPIQIVIAGKAHPLDDGGKEMIRRLVHFAADVEVRGRFAFVEDYDMEVARALVQGCDVWLNNPRRPLEACGTSGMKAALNGALNCSVLDGWWDECYDGRNGWAIGTADTFEDVEYQDRVDASALYDALEREIVPRFYDRSEGPIPRRWVERVKASMSTLGGTISADRMVRDYVERLYEPAAGRGKKMGHNGFTPARALAEWKGKVRAAWDQVSVINIEGEVTAAEVGDERNVAATVRLGPLSTDDVVVQLAHGRVGANGELTNASVVEMEAEGCEDGICVYRGEFTTEEAGLYGFAVRVVPSHPDLIDNMEMGLVTWG
ncbi:MAG: alpha-glucan family phosphorylase [Actinomycetota bacterium]